MRTGTLDDVNADAVVGGAHRNLIAAVRGLVTKVEIIPDPRGRRGAICACMAS